MKKILIVYTTKENTPFQENISIEIIKEIENSLLSLSHLVLCCEFEQADFNKLKNDFKPNVVLNLVYGYLNQKTNTILEQPETTAIIERHFNCIVGTNAKTQKIVQNKLLTGQMLMEIGYNTPTIINIENYEEGNSVIGKPRCGSRHRNIELLNSFSAIKNYTERVKDAIIQEYIPGREFTLGLYQCDGETRAFTPMEIVYESKGNTVMNWEVNQWTYAPDKKDNFNLKEIGISIFNKFKLKDYARIDIRLKGNQPYILDINSLPNLDPEISLLPLVARYDNIHFNELLNLLINSALYNNSDR